MKSHGSPHLAAGTILLLMAALSLCGSTPPQHPSAPPLVIASLHGPDLFQLYCSSCHGRDGRGAPAPAGSGVTPDLTTLAARSGGTFPARRVEGLLTGDDPAAPIAHGPRSMPVWGPIFRGLDPNDARARTRISNIVAHLSSLQEHGAATLGWATYPIGDAPPELQPAIRRGDLIVVSLQGALLTRLRTDLDAGGPELAMQSCHFAAIAAANRVRRYEDIAAGRTAARLRNPMNAPRPWAAAIVSRYADQPSTAVAGFAVDLGDRVGVLRPIREQSICAPCHGPVEKLSPRLRAELADRYPADRATGFREGDIRGWFWVEIPKR